MPTILDQLTLELGWDVKKFLEGAKQTEQIVRNQKDDFERQSRVWEATFGNLGRLLSGVAAAFLSIEAAIRGFEATKQLSRAGTEFANLAEAIGMSTNQLGAWENAMERVGGRAESVRSAFAAQQSQFQNAQIMGGAPSFLGYMQRLGMGDWRQYMRSDGSVDIDRFNKDIADAMNRQNLSPAQRAEYLRGFLLTDPAAQRLYSGNLRGQLEAARPSAVTEPQSEAFRRLNEQWTKLIQSADQVGYLFVEKLEKPLTGILSSLQGITKNVQDFLKGGNLPTDLWQGGISKWYDDWLNRPNTPLKSPQPAVVPPTVTHSDGSVGPSTGPAADWLSERWNKIFGSPPYRGAPASSGGTGRSTPSGTPGGGATAPAPSAPVQAPTPSPFDERFQEEPGATGAPKPYDPLQDFNALPGVGKQSSLGILDLPAQARYASATPSARTSESTTNSSVSIGGMTFNSRSSDTELGTAPSGLMKELSVAQYAFHSDTSIE